MTWQYFLRTLAVASLGLAGLALTSEARAESSIIPPDEAAALARAQAEEVRAAAEAIGSQEAAEAAEGEAGKSTKTAKTNKTIRGAEGKIPAGEKADQDITEETASLPLERPGRLRSAQIDALKGAALKPLIVRHASENGLPYELADAVVRLESRYNPGARNGLNLGLTQINLRTAQSLGYEGGTAGLLEAETNLRYGLKYLAQAYKLAGGDICGTILRYQFGHRTTAMTRASRAYCAKVKVITAAAE